MASFDKTTSTPGGQTLGAALTPASTVTIPEKATLSNTTTAYDQGMDRTPRTSKDSMAQSNPFETDIEAMEVMDPRTNTTNRTCNNNNTSRRSDAHIWPGKEHWKQRAKSARVKKRSCGLLAKLSRRNRIIAKIIIAVLIVGIAVAVGFGVSKPLGAPIWGDNDH